MSKLELPRGGQLYRRWFIPPAVLIVTLIIIWAAFAPIHTISREAVFEIPKGTWARRMSGVDVEILPATIYLTLGIQDVLVLKNNDAVPQVFGPALMMPGQSFTLPFAVASEYQFVCSAHANGQMSVIVQPEPDSAWAKLQWRSFALLRAVQAKLSL